MFSNGKRGGSRRVSVLLKKGRDIDHAVLCAWCLMSGMMLDFLPFNVHNPMMKEMETKDEWLSSELKPLLVSHGVLALPLSSELSHLPPRLPRAVP